MRPLCIVAKRLEQLIATCTDLPAKTEMSLERTEEQDPFTSILERGLQLAPKLGIKRRPIALPLTTVTALEMPQHQRDRYSPAVS